jgi:uncharacterized damage-inducible protein DinB
MNQTIPWFERQFDFSLPLELLPQLLARLRGTPARLQEAVSGCPKDLLIRRVDAAWSAQEHAGHLLDLEALWIARLNDYVEGREQLTPADLTNRKTHEANHNANPIDGILADFRASRQSMLNRVNELDASALRRTLPHPRLTTPMRLLDHLYFVAEHDDHHLACIWELINPD